MKASEILPLAIDWLRERHPDAHIVPEFSVGEYGKALVDVAAILPDRIVGIEIKGEGDTPSRLPLQGMMYSRVCRAMFLLAAPSIEKRCINHLPPGWGLLSVADQSEDWAWDGVGPVKRRAFTGDDDGYGLSPVALAAMPWTKEYAAFGQYLGFGMPRRKVDAIKSVSNHFALPVIERAVCSILRQRDWESKTVHYPAESDTPAHRPPAHRQSGLFGDAA